jgi:Major intrinsic protein
MSSDTRPPRPERLTHTRARPLGTTRKPSPMTSLRFLPDQIEQWHGPHLPGGHPMASALIAEVVLTFFFLLVILGSTHGCAPVGFAPLAIGFCLTLIHLISIPVTNTSVNPARSTGPVVFVGGWALAHLWMFWVAPIAGALVGGFVYRWVPGEESPKIVRRSRVPDRSLFQLRLAAVKPGGGRRLRPPPPRPQRVADSRGGRSHNRGLGLPRHRRRGPRRSPGPPTPPPARARGYRPRRVRH